MTEEEVLQKLESFKNIILKLKNDKDTLFEQLSASSEKYENLKKQSYLTIKHLVEDVIEKQEKELAEKKDCNDEIDKLNRKIKELTEKNIIWEEQFNKQREKIASYEIANKQLENRVAAASRIEQAVDDLDEVVNEVKNEEVHKMVVKPAERELQEMINQN